MKKLLITLLIFPLTTICSAAEPADPMVKGVQDNSFFLEESYNQEPGVVQHIIGIPTLFTGHQKEITPTFTQEWPIFSQTHQFSYTAPYTFADGQNGLRDTRLNYRLQALMEGERTPAFAPRFSLVTPTGDADNGFGHDRLGYEINLPLSKIVSDRIALHFNAGSTLFPDVNDRDLWNYNLGGSVIYAVSKNFNFMLESVANWESDVDAAKNIERTVTALISPGARYAFNLPDNLQIVVGAAVPIGLTSDSPDYGFFLYCSFEHPFVKMASADKK